MKLQSHLSLVTLCVLAASQHARSQPLRPLEHERDLSIALYPWPGQAIARWSGALLVGYQDNMTDGPLISSADRYEKIDRTPIEIPESGFIHIRSVGGGFDGAIVVGGSTGRTRTGFMSWISSDRKQQHLIRTEGFRPESVALDSTGVIWAVGWMMDLTTGKGTDDGILRRYSAAGAMLYSGAVRQLDGRALSSDSTALLASRNLVGWLTYRGEYIEFKLDGAIHDRLPSPLQASRSVRDLVGWGVSEDNDLMVQTATRNDEPSQVLGFDRKKRTWFPVTLPTAARGFRLLGYDGTALMLAEGYIVERLKRVDATVH